MINIYNSIISPIITKKTSSLLRIKQLVFEINKRTNKDNIRLAFKQIFNIDVMKVKTCIIKGKIKRRSNHVGKRKTIKKAIVTFKNMKDINKVNIGDK
jgi:large subunit ribosomal protein L23